MANFNELRKMDVGDALKSIFSRNKNKGSDAAAAGTAEVAPSREQETTDLAHVGEQGYQRSLPGVNILPEATIQRRQNRQLTRRFVAIGAAVAIVSVGCFGGGLALQYFHQKSLEQIQVENSRLTQSVNKLTPYQNSQTSLNTARTSAGTALKNDLDVARLLTDLNSVASRYGVTYTQISMALNAGGTTAATGSSAGCFNPDPFNAPTNIGCLTLSGTASSQDRATSYFNQFKNQTGFLNGFIAGLTTDGTKATFNGTIAFDANFYSNKYTDLNKTVDQEIAASASQAQSSAVITTLKSNYPSVLNGVNSTRLSALPSQVCQAAASNQTNLAIYQQLLATTTGKSVNASDTTGIVRTIVNSTCASSASKLAFLGGTASSSSTSSSATPSSSSTVGTN